MWHPRQREPTTRLPICRRWSLLIGGQPAGTQLPALLASSILRAVGISFVMLVGLEFGVSEISCDTPTCQPVRRGGSPSREAAPSGGKMGEKRGALRFQQTGHQTAQLVEGERLDQHGLVGRVQEPHEKCTAHRFRHTFATSLLESGADIRLIQRLLDHEDIGTTALYLKVRDAGAAQAYSSSPRSGGDGTPGLCPRVLSLLPMSSSLERGRRLTRWKLRRKMKAPEKACKPGSV